MQIIAWLEQTSPGRNRAISVLTEPIQWRGNDPMLKAWVDLLKLTLIDYEQTNS